MFNFIKKLSGKQVEPEKELVFNATAAKYVQHMSNIANKIIGGHEIDYYGMLKQSAGKALPDDVLVLIENLPLSIHSITSNGNARTEIKVLGITITLKGNEREIMSSIINYWVDQWLAEVGDNPPNELREGLIDTLEKTWFRPSFDAIANLYIEEFNKDVK